MAEIERVMPEATSASAASIQKRLWRGLSGVAQLAQVKPWRAGGCQRSRRSGALGGGSGVGLAGALCQHWCRACRHQRPGGPDRPVILAVAEGTMGANNMKIPQMGDTQGMKHWLNSPGYVFFDRNL